MRTCSILPPRSQSLRPYFWNLLKEGGAREFYSDKPLWYLADFEFKYFTFIRLTFNRIFRIYSPPFHDVIPKVSQIISAESWDKNKRPLPVFWALSSIGWVADSDQQGTWFKSHSLHHTKSLSYYIHTGGETSIDWLPPYLMRARKRGEIEGDEDIDEDDEEDMPVSLISSHWE